MIYSIGNNLNLLKQGKETVLKKRCVHATTVFVLLLGITLVSGCTLASPFHQLIANVEEPAEVAEVLRTPRPTFTNTPENTPTATITPTPTATPIPTDTPTPLPPTETPTPVPSDTPTITPTNTPAPPPPPTNTPAPTDTPAPSWQYQLSELYSQPTQANILSIMVAIQTHEGSFIPGLRVVGIDPNGVVTKSEISADDVIGYTPPGEVVKSGNAKFEPISNYVTGTWLFHLESADGTQITDTFPVTMDLENKLWYFLRFQPA
jgi:hypothetical protein